MKGLRIAGIASAVIFALGYLGWLYLTAREAIPEQSDYVIDLRALREMATASGEPLPLRVNHQLVAESSLPNAAIFAGEGFEPHQMIHGAYQIVFPDGFVVIDAAFGRAMFDEQMASADARFDTAAFERVLASLPSARAVVLTHEHFDHIEGLAHASNPDALSNSLVINTRQFANPDTQKTLPATLLERLEPVDADATHVVAPGIVILPAAGHTPGSQIIYVHLQDGRDYLLLGDVVWHMDALRELHYRPRLITDFILNEDRAAVMAQIRTLHGLLDHEGLQMVVSHDGEQHRALVTTNKLGDGFEPFVEPGG